MAGSESDGDRVLSSKDVTASPLPEIKPQHQVDHGPKIAIQRTGDETKGINVIPTQKSDPLSVNRSELECQPPTGSTETEQGKSGCKMQAPVRSGRYFQTVETRNATSTFTDGFVDRRMSNLPSKRLQTPGGPVFFYPLSTKPNIDAALSIVVVNLVTRKPGEEDDTWTYISQKKTQFDKTENKAQEGTPSGTRLRAYHIGGEARDGNASENTQTLLGDVPNPEHPALTTAGRIAVGSDPKSSLDGRSSPNPLLSSAKPASPDKQLVNWLTDEDCLPKALPNARVFQFGYRLVPSKHLTAQFYEELSKSLVEELTKQFSSPDQPKNFVEPILLIACGDGGLVVENAVIYSAENSKCFQSIAGIIFMGSPVCGSKDFSDNMSKKISRDLSPEEEQFLGSSDRTESKKALNSDQLKDLFVEFNRKRVGRGIEIWFFQPKDMRMQGLELLNGQTSNVRKVYNDIGKFQGSNDPDFEKIMLKLMYFSNARQLMNAAKEGRLDQVKRILSQEEIHQVGVDYQNPRGATALHESVKSGREKLLQWLVKPGNASVGLADNTGFTALHFAVQKQSVKAVRMLLEVDANVNARSAEGKSPLDIAKEKAKEKVKEEEIGSGIKWRDNPIYWQLTHRPFLLRAPAHTTNKPLKLPEVPGSEKAVEACKQHTITAVEFFVGKGPVCERRTVYDMIYSKRGAGPFGTLNRARELAMENEKSTWNADMCANKDNSPQLAEPKSVCRWYHIPAQNIAWVHDFLTRIQLNTSTSPWIGQRHDSSQHHGRFIRPFTSIVHTTHNGKDKKISTFCMPFMDYESIIEYNKMVKAVNKEGMDKQFSNIMEILQRMNVLLESLTAGLREAKQTSTSEIEGYPSNSTHSTGHENHANHSAGGGSSDEDVDEISDVEPSNAKLSLISGYLNHEYPLLLRRTLDQYYYYMLLDTSKRDRDQVAYRQQKKYIYNDSRTTCNNSVVIEDQFKTPTERRQALGRSKMLMVDQLWAWVIPGNANSGPDTVITCCSQRWCSESPRDSDLLNSILKFEGRAPAINTTRELLDRITLRCASLFDHSSASKDLQFMEFFRSAIGSASDEETKLFKEFDRLSRELSDNQSVRNAKERKKRAETLNQLLEIENETKLLISVKDIQDEISTILVVLGDQGKILRDAREDIKKLRNVGLNPGSEYLGFREAYQKTINNIEDFKKSQAQAKKIQQALNHLLELKSRQANAWEARFAREGGEEIARQGTIILIFTIVNIIFLPLSFMAAFMALNIAQFPRDDTPGNDGGTLWPISTALRLLLSVSLGISTVIILAALKLSAIRDLLKTYVTLELAKIPKPIQKVMSLLAFWREKALPDALPHIAMDNISYEIEQHERSIFRGEMDSEDAKSEASTDAGYSESEESGSAGSKDSTQGWPRWRGVKTLRNARQMKWPKDLRWWRKNIEMENVSPATVAEGDQRV